MLPYPVILTVSAVVLVLTAVIVGLVSGSFTATLVVVALAGVLVYIMTSFGTISAKQGNSGINIDVQPIPNPNTGSSVGLGIKEVFHLSQNMYTYAEAPAVCAAYGAELASYDQLIEAHTNGAEWCGYGWSATGMALYPTQQATWQALQRDPSEFRRTACGHPGVNGGYFDPRLKFGVNCYGRKPPNTGTKLPQPLPGSDSGAGFNKMVNKFKSMITSMKLSPFNRNIWSKNPLNSAMPSSAPAELPHRRRDDRTVPMEPSASHASKPSNTPIDESTAYDKMRDYSQQLCSTFGVCDYKNDKEAAHKQAENATDAEARDKAAGDKGPMSHQK
jgi:hypothetical protein